MPCKESRGASHNAAALGLTVTALLRILQERDHLHHERMRYACPRTTAVAVVTIIAVIVHIISGKRRLWYASHARRDGLPGMPSVCRLLQSPRRVHNGQKLLPLAQADDYALFQNSCFPPSHAHFLQPTCAAIPDNTTAKMASRRP